MTAGLEFKNKDGDTFEFSSYKNLRLLGKYDSSAPTTLYTSAPSNHTQTIDLRGLLPDGFTFNNSTHKFEVSKLIPRTVNSSRGSWAFNANINFSHPLIGNSSIVINQGDSVSSTSFRVPFPDFSIAANGYTLTITSSSYTVPQAPVSQNLSQSSFCNAIANGISDAVAANPTLTGYTLNSCTYSQTNTQMYAYEGGSYSVILTEA